MQLGYLVPLLFLIYIHDLENGIKSKVVFFCFSIVKPLASMAAVLNNDLELISQWKMSFNPEPSKQAVEILFSNRKTKTAHPFLFFNGAIVNKDNEHKHLGLTMDSNYHFPSTSMIKSTNHENFLEF